MSLTDNDVEDDNSTRSKANIELLSNANNQDQLAGTHTTITDKISSLFRFNSPDSPSLKFERLSKDKTVFSRSKNTFGGSFRKVFSRKIDWGSLKNMAKEWIKNPMNMVLFLWIVCVAISGAILFLVMTGMLNNALPKKSQRNTWFEVNNQILNALFTLMCLYQHPQRLYHLVLLSRWRPGDVSKLRKIYCKTAGFTPRERTHMMVVVFLLNLNCFAQYALCGLTVGYRRSDRPAIGVAVTLSIAFGAPAIAGVYSVVSPLGKVYDIDIVSDEDTSSSGNLNRENLIRLPVYRFSDEESKLKNMKSFERRFSFAPKDGSRDSLTDPKWSGGLFDFWDDISSAYLSLFCSFCVFGWNMERLGFGNMYVHIATFLLFCLAPFWIFTLAAINIDNDNVRMALTITGVFLCVFGLLYGGFWRIQMRKRFNLPRSSLCRGQPDVVDCASWLCCCWCSLAQEVRTGNAYDIIEDKFYKKRDTGSDEKTILPLAREGEHVYYRPSPIPTVNLSTVEEGSSSRGNDATLEPPVPSRIHRDGSY